MKDRKGGKTKKENQQDDWGTLKHDNSARNFKTSAKESAVSNKGITGANHKEGKSLTQYIRKNYSKRTRCIVKE